MLSRTILTSAVTLIPILCLFLFGGPVLRDFSLTIIVGFYSSIFIASSFSGGRAPGAKARALCAEGSPKNRRPPTRSPGSGSLCEVAQVLRCASIAFVLQKKVVLLNARVPAVLRSPVK